MDSKGILLYIDPGTGAMLFTVIMGVVTTLMFTVQKLWLKIKFIISGGQNDAKHMGKLGIVIFSDSKRYWNVFKPICDEFEKRKKVCYYWTASPDDPALNEPYEYVKCEFIGEGNRAFARLNMMKADICMSTTPGLDVYQWKRSENVGCYVHIPHDVGELTAYRMFGLDYYDAVLLTGEFQEKALRDLEVMRGTAPKEMCVTGSTYMDVLYAKAQRVRTKQQERNEQCDVLSCGKTTVLVAPSWGTSSILNRYGEKFLQKLQETGYNIIIRPHPQSKISDSALLEDLQKKFPDNDHWSWNYDNDNFEVLSKSDILISDFSGVIFDFALVFGKPVIYADTHLDQSPYDSCWLQEVPWKLQILPKIGFWLKEEDFADMRQVIEAALTDETCMKGREDAKAIAWRYQGEASQRVVDYLEEKQKVFYA